MCINEEIAAEKVNGQWRIDASAALKLIENKQRLSARELDALKEVPATKKDEALRKLGLIWLLEKYTSDVSKAGCLKTETMRTFCLENSLPVRSMRRWQQRYRADGIKGLLDGRGAGKVNNLISPDAFELFKTMYLTQQQLSTKVCWQNIRFVNKEQNKGWLIPPLRTMQRYANERIPLFVRVLNREGLAAYEAKCAPYVLTDPDSVEPGQVWIGDHHQFNCWIRGRNKWVRPWLTAWMDMRSRTIVGWHISANPNQSTILLGMKRAIERYGPPESVKIDNGKDYDSEAWTGTTKVRRRAIKAGYIDEQMIAGIYALMNIGVTFSIKYHPQSKAIERLFDTVDCQFTKTIKTYCGKDSQRKPDYLPELLKSKKILAQALSLIEFEQKFERYAKAYNNTSHSGFGMDGQTPATVMAARSSRRVMLDGVLELLMRVWSGELGVGKNGVKFKGMWYGQFSPELMINQGKKVRVSYDPDDLRQVYVYDSATLKLITIAEQAKLIQYGSKVDEANLRAAMHQKGQAVKFARQYRDSRLAAAMDLTDLTLSALEDAAEPEPQKRLPATIKPVMTPLDKQVKAHKQKLITKAVRKAAGAEGTTTVLDIDFETIKKERTVIDLGLFNGD